MPDSSHTGKSCVHTGSEGRSPHLGHTPHRQHHGGQIQAGVIKGQGPAGLRAGKGKALFQHKQQEEKYHAQQKIVGVYHCQGGLTGKSAEFGELPVKYAACQGQGRIQQGRIHVTLHTFLSFI